MPNIQELINCHESQTKLRFLLKNGKVKNGVILHIIKDEFIIIRTDQFRIKHDLIKLTEIFKVVGLTN
ncbi:MAG TPA: hypothetical protein VD927_20130 [Chryseosolibacter sp.]|nr:hypothetical protein [Chryseosolibacter sp.]